MDKLLKKNFYRFFWKIEYYYYMGSKIRKHIRILEVPLYLLIISMFCMESGSMGISLFLIIISILRLITNVVTDDSVYKNP